MKKIIQIATSESRNNNEFSRYLLALCEDGKLYQKDMFGRNPWEEVEGIKDD